MALPPPVAEGLARLADGPRETIGRRLAELDRRRAREPGLATGRPRPNPLREPRTPMRQLSSARRSRATCSGSRRRCRTTEPDTRAVLVGAQVVGLALARYIVRVEPLASMSSSDVVEFYAPTFQHYLVGPLRA